MAPYIQLNDTLPAVESLHIPQLPTTLFSPTTTVVLSPSRSLHQLPKHTISMAPYGPCLSTSVHIGVGPLLLASTPLLAISTSSASSKPIISSPRLVFLGLFAIFAFVLLVASFIFWRHISNSKQKPAMISRPAVLRNEPGQADDHLKSAVSQGQELPRDIIRAMNIVTRTGPQSPAHMDVYMPVHPPVPTASYTNMPVLTHDMTDSLPNSGSSILADDMKETQIKDEDIADNRYSWDFKCKGESHSGHEAAFDSSTYIASAAIGLRQHGKIPGSDNGGSEESFHTASVLPGEQGNSLSESEAVPIEHASYDGMATEKYLLWQSTLPETADQIMPQTNKAQDIGVSIDEISLNKTVSEPEDDSSNQSLDYSSSSLELSSINTVEDSVSDKCLPGTIPNDRNDLIKSALSISSIRTFALDLDLEPIQIHVVASRSVSICDDSGVLVQQMSALGPYSCSDIHVSVVSDLSTSHTIESAAKQRNLPVLNKLDNWFPRLSNSRLGDRLSASCSDPQNVLRSATLNAARGLDVVRTTFQDLIGLNHSKPYQTGDTVKITSSTDSSSPIEQHSFSTNDLHSSMSMPIALELASLASLRRRVKHKAVRSLHVSHPVCIDYSFLLLQRKETCTTSVGRCHVSNLNLP